MANSLEEPGGCKLKGEDFVLKPGLLFARKLSDNFTLWGEVRIGTAYQKFLETDRRKIWLDVRQFYISNRPIFDNTNYYNYLFSVGRILISEPRGFWFYNSIDGIRIDYLTTLLKSSFWLGKRINDVYVTNNEERNNISGYTYIAGMLDYQYRYRQHLQAFYVKEYRGSSSKPGDVFDIWSPVKERENLNWIGARWTYLREDIFKSRYFNLWLDLGYMWGNKDSICSIREDCTATGRVVSVTSDSANGIGFELGGKFINNNTGLGARIAGGSKDFYQPRVSSNRERLFGPNTIRYYGEFANPDLTNILVVGIFGGYQWKANHWLELNILKYDLMNPSAKVSLSRFLPLPNGESKDLGWEVDFILEGEEKKISSKWRYYLIGSYFKPGSAYSGVSKVDRAYGFFLDVKRNW